MHDIVVRGTCDSGFLDAFRDRQVPWQVSIDLSGMTFCDPLGLVALAAFAEAAVRAGERVVVRRPTDPAVANYLARMRLGNVLGSLGVEHDLPWVHEHEVGDALLELTPFDGARGAGALARHVHGVVEPLDLAAANALHDGICEAGQNVAHHSQRDRGFVAAQRYSGDRLQFAVGDSGVGMLTTLRWRGATGHADALRRSLTPGVTGTSDTSRGNGLPDMVDQLSALGGRLELLSGSAALTARGGRRWSSGERALEFPGTLLQGVAIVGP